VVDALSTDIGPVNTPRVVVGVPPSESSDSVNPPSVAVKGGSTPAIVGVGLDPLEALEALEKPKPIVEHAPEPPPTQAEAATGASATNTKTSVSFASTMPLGSPDPSASAQPEGAPEIAPEEAAPEAAEEKDEKTQKTPTFASTLTFGSVRADVEPVSGKASFASTLVLGSTLGDVEATEAVEARTSKTTTDEAVQPVKVVEPPLPVPKPVAEQVTSTTSGGKKNKKKNAAKVDAASPPNEPDEISVPPIGDISVDDRFFSQGDVSRHLASDAIEGDALTIPDKAKRKAEPHVVQRRARFARYVKWAVAGAAVVCVAALARTTLSSKATASTTIRPTMAIAATMEAPAAPKAATSAVAPIVEPTAATVTAADPAAADKAAPEAKPEELTGNAKEEKTSARTLLEKRKIAEAIEAGERSVKLDPTDGEAWLILGASYQEKGNMVDARRAYASCVKEATTGPRDECAKMLR
jgi:hypothetical protein